MSNQNIINPKPCNYGCGTRIYWDTISNSFLEIFTKQKHICKNRSTGKKDSADSAHSYTKPNYYNRFSKQPNPHMSNSLELISGPILEVQKNYEILSDIVSDYNGKVHGSQSHIITNNELQLIIYYEVPVGMIDKVKEVYNEKRNSLLIKFRQ